MFREERTASANGSGFSPGLCLRAAIATAALVAASRADDRGIGPRTAPEAARSDAEARAAALELLLPELSGSSGHEEAAPEVLASSTAIAPRAVVRQIGIAAPGLRVTLDASGTTGQPRWYRWVQTQGPPTPLETDGGPTATLTVPAEAGSLAYLLLVGNAAGADVAGVLMPIEGKVSSARSGELRADAGDDQIGQVGRQVTLNGIRSLPRGRLGYRWVQVAGPKVSLKIEDGYIFTFVPPANGLYQFALVVASGSEISEPDHVNVAVGVPLPPPAEEPAPAPAPAALKDLARAALADMEGGPSAAEDLGDAFQDIASKMDLYTSYDELMLELTRRLEEVVPADAQRRAAWLGRVFAPLTARVIERMLAEGLDLSRPDGRAAGLTRPQRKALAQQFRSIAQGFRAAAAR